eukprot:TRINITY_DN848_c0_g1_i1.p1 TRINITY_DN848_c0_g1~~TRINITY_DN848_c0_g1_i1.p1  ORF type:complete len:820 (+),score=208.92 TRINITY_DN848_c0_g1_i1:48-2462(+)
MGGKRKRGRWQGHGKGKGKGKKADAGGSGEDEEDAGEDEDGGREAKRGARGGGRGEEDAWRDCEPWELENASFEAYYRRQGICSEEEFLKLLATLKTGLPAAIRVNRMRLGAPALCDRLQELLTVCGADGDERGEYAPQKLQWYPHGLGWMWPSLERRLIKKDRRHASLKGYLAQRERAGLISRQEVVSMLPPLFLGLESHHLVLDLCAAPGSKTSQMLEVMHWAQVAQAEEGAPKGLVLANELQWRRANMLAHQVGRLGSPCMVVVNCDAMFFPDMYCPSSSMATEAEAGNGVQAREQLRFDRVLCDVPCSGDGTMRKTPYIWKSWTFKGGLALHIRQLTILNRGLDLLKTGGRLVYSTCSLNPIEDEAVVAAALRRHGDAIALVPPPADLSERIKAGRGLATWAVPHSEKDGEFFTAIEDVPQELKQGKNKLLASMFPPYGDFAKTWETARGHCRRLLPHLENTGGFFIAVFEKRAELPPSAKARREARNAEHLKAKGEAAAKGEPSAAANADDAEEEQEDEEEKEEAAGGTANAKDQADAAVPPKGKGKGPPPLRRITKEYAPIAEALGTEEWQKIADFFGLDPAHMHRFVMRAEGDRQMFYISEGAQKLLRSEVKLPTRMVMCGVLALQRIGSYHERSIPWRLAQDGLAQLVAALGFRRQLQCKRSLLRRFLAEKELTLQEVRSAVEKGEAKILDGLLDPKEPAELLPGSLALTLLPEAQDSRPHPFAIAATLSDGAVELQVSPTDAASLAEDLDGQPSVDQILGASAGAEEEDEAEGAVPMAAMEADDIRDPDEDDAGA